MRVKELIEELKKAPKNMTVMIYNGKEAFDIEDTNIADLLYEEPIVIEKKDGHTKYGIGTRAFILEIK